MWFKCVRETEKLTITTFTKKVHSDHDTWKFIQAISNVSVPYGFVATNIKTNYQTYFYRSMRDRPDLFLINVNFIVLNTYLGP